jgi:hypothetical protein
MNTNSGENELLYPDDGHVFALKKCMFSVNVVYSDILKVQLHVPHNLAILFRFLESLFLYTLASKSVLCTNLIKYKHVTNQENTYLMPISNNWSWGIMGWIYVAALKIACAIGPKNLT